MSEITGSILGTVFIVFLIIGIISMFYSLDRFSHSIADTISTISLVICGSVFLIVVMIKIWA